ncbi:DUF1501 domain-containing protein [Tautonia marina]|uniref:DUF1501 domain-containing protein n=1 Tax=Tautonia marina TaxID=2653855 RepID=UPI00126056D9|nr:DUF1501 domain-containing protein [Tautonia marina]
MIRIKAADGRLVASGPSRREAMRIGALGLGGLTLPRLLRAQDEAAGRGRKPGKARSVIILFLSGGPSHLDTFDLKPEAPEEIRGTFRPIATNVPGVMIADQMPRTARLADRFAIVRSVQHPQANHPAAAYWMMVGSPIARPVRDSGFMSRADRPHPGSALAKILGPTPGVPPFVMLPEAMQPNGPERSGQHAGFLGAAFDPYRINSDPNLFDYDPGAVSPPAGMKAERFGGRRQLLSVVEGTAEHLTRTAGVSEFDAYAQAAFDLISSPEARRAFDIEAEPEAVRDRYGRHVFGQSVLLARRMVEAGVRLVHVNWVRHDGGKGGQGYDTHRNHLSWSETELMPPTDAAFSALLEDLHDRGLLDETLVILMGEFGRTPRFNKNAGRDHWPHCFSVVLAGGGIQGGQVLGASDAIGAYPTSDPVTPGDLIATLHHSLGVHHETLIHDLQRRPYPLAEGTPLHTLF